MKQRIKGLHLEPVWWGLFSAGGVCFAVLVPSVALVFGLLWPLGVVDVSFTTLQAWYQSLWGLVFTAVAISLPAFHAAHRIRHGLHDMKIGYGGSTTAFVCYGSAMVVTALGAIAWWSA